MCPQAGLFTLGYQGEGWILCPECGLVQERDKCLKGIEIVPKWDNFNPTFIIQGQKSPSGH